jgi:hypothetical protein
MFVDIADFLQELPTEEGARFINPKFKRAISQDNLLASVNAAAAGLKVKRSLVSPSFVPKVRPIFFLYYINHFHCRYTYICLYMDIYVYLYDYTCIRMHFVYHYHIGYRGTSRSI